MTSARGARLSMVAAATLLLGLLAPVGTATADPTPPGPASVTIVSPTAGQVANGVLHVTVVGHVGAVSDRPRVMSLSYGDDYNSFLKSADCETADTDPDPWTCSITFTWDTWRALDGQQLVAGLTVMHDTAPSSFDYLYSPSVKLRIFHPTTAHLNRILRPITAGAKFWVSGHVDIPHGNPLSGAVLLTYRPRFGPTQQVITHLYRLGEFKTTLTGVSPGTITATVVATKVLGASSSTIQVQGWAHITCTMPTRVARGHVASGNCVVPYLQKGNTVSIQLHTPLGWRNFETGGTPTAGHLAFAYRFPYAGTYYLRLVTAAHDGFVKTIGKAMTVVVS